MRVGTYCTISGQLTGMPGEKHQPVTVIQQLQKALSTCNSTKPSPMQMRVHLLFSRSSGIRLICSPSTSDQHWRHSHERSDSLSRPHLLAIPPSRCHISQSQRSLGIPLRRILMTLNQPILECASI